MSPIFHLSFRRRIGRQWTERVNSLRDIRDRMIAASERALRRLFGNEGALVPIPVKTTTRQRRADPSRSHD
jgi:hypothetical protein